MGEAPCSGSRSAIEVMMVGVADESLHHVSFMPSLLARPGLLQNLYVDSAVRSAWAHEALGH